MNMSKSLESPLGSLQMSILSILWSREMYGLEIIKHLKIKGYVIGTNQLYPALKRLESMNAVESRKEERVGTTRIYYKITSNGKHLMLKQLVGLIDLFQDILLEKLDFMGSYCAEILRIKPGMKILDFSKDFYDSFVHSLVGYIRPNGNYYILVNDKENQNLYCDRIEFFQYENIVSTIIPEPQNKLNLPNCCIDCVVAFFSLRKSPQTIILREINRILKPNGKGLIVDWPMTNKDVRNNMILAVFPEKRGIDEEDIRQELQKYGFETIIHNEKEGIAVIEFKKPT